MKILVAIDPSPASQAVVSRVAAQPWPVASTFEVLSVADSSDGEEELTRRMSAIAEEAARQLCARNLNASFFVMHDHPKAAIVDRAKETGADLVVIGSHNGDGIGHFLMGGVASAVLRHAPCSVEVVRAGGDLSAGMKILLATDGSDRSLAAARAIAKRPWPAGTEVRVLTALELTLTLLQSALEPPYLNSDLVEMQRAEAMKRAEKAIQSSEEIVAAAGLKTEESISVLLQSPQQIILDEAKEWGADLIVVGCYGRGGLDRFLLGSVSEAVALHAECSVEVVRSPAG
jgi:nucleotide-binding universal stress UspA family protein